ncbi:MAG TPA: hypothetical protein PK454_10145 [Anaerolineaceae bacterium]|nr:hypothetical protein [Anaerolineaceae bacterium]
MPEKIASLCLVLFVFGLIYNVLIDAADWPRYLVGLTGLPDAVRAGIMSAGAGWGIELERWRFAWSTLAAFASQVASMVIGTVARDVRVRQTGYLCLLGEVLTDER